MSGHSKWSSIKHKKAATDAKRGKIFTKINKEITMAAKMGGGDPASNARLRRIIEDAKAANMPNENVKKAIQRGTGELPGVTYEELVYEGYGPGGTAVIVNVTTDNKNRSASDIRKIFSKRNGNLGESGCVAWMFDKRGLIEVRKETIDEETLLNVALDIGVEDIKTDDKNVYEIITDPNECETVKEKLEKENVSIDNASVTMIPQTYIKLEGSSAKQMIDLMDDLDDNDDVVDVYANFDISEDIIEQT